MSQQKELKRLLKDMSVTSTTFSIVEVQVLSMIERTLGRSIGVADLIGHREIRRLPAGVYRGNISLATNSFVFCLREKTRRVYSEPNTWRTIGDFCVKCGKPKPKDIFIPIARAIFDWGDDYELEEPRILGFDPTGVGDDRVIKTSIILMKHPGCWPNRVHYFVSHHDRQGFNEVPINTDRGQRDHDEYWNELWGGKVPPDLVGHAKYYTD